MRNKKILTGLAVVAAAVALSGTLAACGKKETKPEASVETGSMAETVDTGAVEETGGAEIEVTEKETVQSALKESGTNETQGKGAETDAGDASTTADNGLFGIFSSKTIFNEDVDQNIFTEADLTMVNIWGTFCGPCIREMPDLGELSQEYEEKGVKIVGIVSDVIEAEDAQALEIVEATKADYTHIVLSEDLYANYLNKVSVVPTTVFVDREGKQVGSVYAGAKSKAQWAKLIDELLEQVK